MSQENTSLSINFEVDPIFEFRAELNAIKSHFYLGIVAEALMKIPSYFWFVPASSSGKYHPKSSLGMGGLLRHVRSVFAISEELLAHPLYAPFTDDEKDEIRVAILLHDACKQGVSNTGSHTVVEHPLLVREALNPMFTPDGKPIDLQNEEEAQVMEVWDRICNLIETHMGIWTKNKQNEEILQVPQTKAQLFVHMCDYLASRKIIEVDITPRDAQSSSYGKKDESWKDALATPSQIEYVKKLMVMCMEKKVDSPVPYTVQIVDSTGKQVYTKGEASEHIGKLKSALGIA